MTDAEIKKALECCNDELHWCSTCPYFLQDKENDLCREDLCKDALELINRQQAEIEELTHKLECLLCHATGSKLSKSTYSLRTMELAVNDEVQECCQEAKAEAINKFAERLKEHAYRLPTSFFEIKAVNESRIDAILKEMVGDAE